MLPGVVPVVRKDLRGEVEGGPGPGVVAGAEDMTALLADASLSAFAAVRTAPGVDVSVNSPFEYGLTRFLDGVALLVQRAPDARTARPTARTQSEAEG